MHRFHSSQFLKRSFSPMNRHAPHFRRMSSSASDLSHPESSERPPTPVLLLEGNKFELSSDGTLRTLYKLNHSSATELLVEELYDINRSKKMFVLRRTIDTNPTKVDTINLGSAYQTIELQELDANEVGTVGTGAMSWESSVAMSLFFSANPSLLSGKILELGSGCGHGGILVLSQLYSNRYMGGNSASDWPLITGAFPSCTSNIPSIDSFIFTDYQRDILAQCQRNIHNTLSKNNCSLLRQEVKCQTKLLDWTSPPSDLPQLQTILASDCAFRYCDIEPLSDTIVRLLSTHEDTCFHTFGPINRGALHTLIDALRNKGMDVVVETLNMERFRLLPARSREHNLEKTAQYASRGNAKFLHVTARQRNIEDDNGDQSAPGDMYSLD